MRLLFAELSDIFRVYSLRITVYCFFLVTVFMTYELQFTAFSVDRLWLADYSLRLDVLPSGAVNRKL